MKIEIVHEETQESFFVLSGTNAAFINTIRRLVIDEVPSMAIEEVEVHKNDSALYDEFIAHRLGLVPLTTDLKNYTFPVEGEIRDARSEVELTIQKKGEAEVVSGDLQSKDPAIAPVFDNIMLTKLLEGQEFELVCRAILGKGKDHAKFSPGLLTFQQTPQIVVAKNADASRVQKALETKKATGITVSGGKVAVDDTLVYQADNIDIYEELSPEDISVTYDNDSYVVHAESWGQLAVKDMLQQACVELDAKLEELKKKL